MMKTGLRPSPEDGREVFPVACHEDPPLVCGQLEDLSIGEGFESPFFREREHVVAIPPKRSTDPLR